jgi:phenylacetate-coenzyme A ligase PaaK-like adenylate-forming protein
MVFRPDYIIGFSRGLELFLTEAERLGFSFSGLRIKLVIGAAEGFWDRERVERIIRQKLGCRLAMEYGTVECGNIAYTVPDGRYQVFWDTHLVEAIRTGEHAYEAYVTNLYNKYVPLFRYKLGDCIQMWESDRDVVTGVRWFDDVCGRENDYLQIDRKYIHFSVLTDTARLVPGIKYYQFIKRGSGLTLNVIPHDGVRVEDIEKSILPLLLKVDKCLAGVRVQKVDRLMATVGGKVKSVMELPMEVR